MNGQPRGKILVDNGQRDTLDTVTHKEGQPNCTWLLPSWARFPFVRQNLSSAVYTCPLGAFRPDHKTLVLSPCLREVNGQSARAQVRSPPLRSLRLRHQLGLPRFRLSQNATLNCPPSRLPARTLVLQRRRTLPTRVRPHQRSPKSTNRHVCMLVGPTPSASAAALWRRYCRSVIIRVLFSSRSGSSTA
jgi:hypothetical protein